MCENLRGQIARLCRFVACCLLLVACRLSLVACRLSLVACRLSLVAKNCVGRAGACQVLVRTFMRFCLRMFVTGVGADAFHYDTI